MGQTMSRSLFGRRRAINTEETGYREPPPPRHHDRQHSFILEPHMCKGVHLVFPLCLAPAPPAARRKHPSSLPADKAMLPTQACCLLLTLRSSLLTPFSAPRPPILWFFPWHPSPLTPHSQEIKRKSAAGPTFET